MTTFWMKYALEYYEQQNLVQSEQPPQIGETLQPEQTLQAHVYSLFPNPSFKWRFIKIDGNNLNTLLPDIGLLKIRNETRHDYTLRCFSLLHLILRNLKKVESATESTKEKRKKKYTPRRRKDTNRNRRKRDMMINRRSPATPNIPIQIKRTNHKRHFNEGDAARMPLVIFGDGMKGKSQAKHKGYRVGVSEIIYRQLKRKEKLGEVLALDINEFRTSSLSGFDTKFLHMS
ncbi:hypothetical protein BDF21DRAFT_455023 [Thamnidium elegans]|nr:hypothetical protein BDF21DRAFT_455023 [Thamnidium elegans]